MGRYLVKVEDMDGRDTLDQEYRDGIECDGFCLLLDKGEDATVAIEHVSIDDISDMMVHNDQLLSAGILAKAKIDVVERMKKHDARKRAESILGSLFNAD